MLWCQNATRVALCIVGILFALEIYLDEHTVHINPDDGSIVIKLVPRANNISWALFATPKNDTNISAKNNSQGLLVMPQVEEDGSSDKPNQEIPPPGSSDKPSQEIPPPRFPAGTTFYTMERQDRSGAAILEMIDAYAYTFYYNALGYNLTYGGVCRHHRRKSSVINNNALLKAVGLNKIFRYVECKDKKDPIIDRTILPKMLSESGLEKGKLYSGAFLHHIHDDIRKNQTMAALEKDNVVPQVVVHIRRGDVHPCRFAGLAKPGGKSRYLPNEYFIDVIRKYAPAGSQIHIFSEKASWEPWDGFESKIKEGTNYTVRWHLSKPVTEAWQYMTTADALIMSRSTFSQVPAMLNPNAVIYSAYWNPPLPGWTIVDDPEIRKKLGIKMREYEAKDGCPGVGG